MSEGIATSLGIVDIREAVAVFSETGRLPEGWACDASESGVAFFLDGEEGNLLIDPKKKGYRRLDDLLKAYRRDA